MAKNAYAFQKRPSKDGVQKRTARARLTGINASFKDLGEVCRAVRYKPSDDALSFLEAASEKEQAIPMLRHGKRRGHVRQLGGKRGGWPVKSAKIVFGVLQSAVANATKLGLSTTRIAHVMANKQHTFPRMSPKGRRIRHDFETAFVEIVLEEWAPKLKEEKKAKSQKGAGKAEGAKATEAKATASPKIEGKAAEKQEKKVEAKPAAVEAKPEKQAAPTPATVPSKAQAAAVGAATGTE